VCGNGRASCLNSGRSTKLLVSKGCLAKTTEQEQTRDEVSCGAVCVTASATVKSTEDTERYENLFVLSNFCIKTILFIW